MNINIPKQQKRLPRKLKKRLKQEIQYMSHAWYSPVKIHNIKTLRAKDSFEKVYDVTFSLCNLPERHTFSVNAPHRP